MSEFKEYIPFLIKAQNSGAFTVDGSLKVLEAIDSINGKGKYNAEEIKTVVLQALELGNANSKGAYTFDEIRVLKQIYEKATSKDQNLTQVPAPKASAPKEVKLEPKISELKETPSLETLSESEIKELALKQLNS